MAASFKDDELIVFCNELRFAPYGERNPQLKKNAYIYFMYYLPYNSNLKQFSHQLRNNSTLGEILLWKRLRAGSVMKYSFNRQKPLNHYIVDFYCKPLNLVIEVDGEYHNAPLQKIKDNERQQLLESMGLSFLRFTEQQVRKDMEWVIREIENYIREYEIKYPAAKDATKRYDKKVNL